MSKELILSDLDLTLLHTDLSLSDFTVEVWNEAVNRGHRLSIATARSYTGVSKLLDRLTLKEPLILLDGALIMTIDGKIVYEATLNAKIGNRVLDIANKTISSAPLIVGLDDNNCEQFLYPPKPNIFQQELIDSFHNDRRVITNSKLKAMDRNLKIVFMESEKKSQILQEALISELGDTIEIKASKDPYIDCCFITILHPNGDKSKALKKLEEFEHTTAKDTVVFGDSYNDLGLFEFAGTKIAVANAIKELKESADIILPYTNDEDAVAKYLNEYLKLNISGE